MQKLPKLTYYLWQNFPYISCLCDFTAILSREIWVNRCVPKDGMISDPLPNLSQVMYVLKFYNIDMIKCWNWLMDQPTVSILDMTAIYYYTKFDLVPNIIFCQKVQRQTMKIKTSNTAHKTTPTPQKLLSVNLFFSKLIDNKGNHKSFGR